MKRTVVIGGGISGLTTAYRLVREKAGEVLLLEASPKLGGNIKTERVDGLVLDGGPDSWVAAKPQAAALCRELGLGDRLVGTLPQNRSVYILRRGKLVPMPEGLILGLPTKLRPFLSSELLSWPAKLRVLLEAGRRKGPEGDPSIAAFLKERFGREMAEVILEPLLGGVFAGDGEKISLAAAFPQLSAMAHQHGSLLRAARGMRRPASAKASSPPSPFLSLRGGMGELVEALERAIGEGVIRKGATVASVQKSERGFAVRLEGGEVIEASDVVVALPAHAAAKILASIDPELSHELYAIPYVSTATVFFAWDRDQVAHALDSTGFLVPIRERKHVMAATFVSSKWPGRAPEGKVLVRAFLGGGHGERVLDGDDERLVSLARAELFPLLGARAEPLLTRVVRFHRASPQPVVGHLERMERIREKLAREPRLSVIGNAYEGVGIPDCVRHAERVAAAIAAQPA